MKASPLARSIAAQRNIPLDAITGSGPGGRIIKRDVEAGAAASRPAAPPRPPPRVAPAPARAPAPTVRPGEEILLSEHAQDDRAPALREHVQRAPHFYVTVEIDMDRAVALREQLLAAEDVKVSFNDLIVKACAKALSRFPTSTRRGASDRIATHAEVHVGVAVAMPDGLIVPVVRNADRKCVVEIAREVKDLAGARARAQAQARGVHGLHLHHLQPRHVRRHRVHGDHQPARRARSWPWARCASCRWWTATPSASATA